MFRYVYTHEGIRPCDAKRKKMWSSGQLFRACWPSSAEHTATSLSGITSTCIPTSLSFVVLSSLLLEDNDFGGPAVLYDCSTHPNCLLTAHIHKKETFSYLEICREPFIINISVLYNGQLLCTAEKVYSLQITPYTVHCTFTSGVVFQWV